MQPILQGLVAAPYTPFRANGDLLLDVIPRQAALLSHNAVSGAFICGTTGEGQSLSTDERRQVAEAWRSTIRDPLKLVVHVGHLSLRESRVLAHHAQEIGADAIASLAPSFFKPANAADLIAWCAEVAAAAPKLPFYYYHMPAMTGVNILVTDFLNAANGHIPTLAGIKFTHENLMDYSDAGQIDGGRYSMLFGRDEILLAGLSLGAAGAVGSTYNFAAPLFIRLVKAFDNGDLATARLEQSRAREFIAVIQRYGGLVAGKAVMKLIGVDCGPVRLPLRPLSESQESELRSDLERIGFFDYCCTLP